MNINTLLYQIKFNNIIHQQQLYICINLKYRLNANKIVKETTSYFFQVQPYTL